MRFATKEDISCPIEETFQRISDFDMLERLVMRRGAEIKRMEALTEKGLGMRWKSNFRFRGRARELKMEVVDFEEPNKLGFHIKIGGLDARMDIDLIALSTMRTRISVQTVLEPQTLSAKLLVQSLKLSRSRLNRKFQLRVNQWAQILESK